MPFPGKFPTRWRIVLIDSKTHKTLYDEITKPDPKRIALIDRWVHTGRNKHLILIEFDRGGAIRYCYSRLPAQLMLVQSWNMAVSYIYYPWHDSDGEFFKPWRTPLYATWLQGIKQGFFFYCPWEYTKSESQFAQIREYKSWLRKHGVLK
jgi:hypothetical protein